MEFCLDKFQGLIQMKDVATAQSAKLVGYFLLSNSLFSIFLSDIKWTKYLPRLLHITNRFFQTTLLECQIQ